MEENEILQKLSKYESSVVGLLALAVTGIFFLIRVGKAVIKTFQIFRAEKIFESYNENVKLIGEKNITYKLKTLTLKKDSLEIYESMKLAYDLENEVKIDSKSISFKLYEVPDDEVLFSNVVKFLEYYKLKNGVKINIFLSDPVDPSGGIKKQLIEYLSRANIRGAKIV